VYEGLVPVRRIRGEYFDLNETETALVGRRSGRSIRLGDPLSVRVDRVEAPRGRVDLLPAGDIGAGGTAASRGRGERR
jgi:ribonuclease R